MKKKSIVIAVAALLLVIAFLSVYFLVKPNSSNSSEPETVSYKVCIVRIFEGEIVGYTDRDTVHASRLFIFGIRSDTLLLDSERNKIDQSALAPGQICEIEAENLVQYLGPPHFPKTKRITLTKETNEALFLEGERAYSVYCTE